MEDDEEFDDAMFDMIDSMVQQHESTKAHQHAPLPQMQQPTSPAGAPRPAAHSHSPSAHPSMLLGMQPQPHQAPSAMYGAPGAHALSGHHALPAQPAGRQLFGQQQQVSSMHAPAVAVTSILPPPSLRTSAPPAGLHTMPLQQQLHPLPAMPHMPGDAPAPVNLPQPLPNTAAHAQDGWPHAPSSFAAQQQQLQQGVPSGHAQTQWQQQQQQQQQHLRQPLLAAQPQRAASNGSQGMSALPAPDASTLPHQILVPAAAAAAAASPPPPAGASRVGLAASAGGGAATWGAGSSAHPPAAHMPLQHQRHAHASAEHSRQLQQLQQQLEFARHEADELRRRARDGDARAVAAEKQLSGALKERQRQESLRAVAEAELRQERERKALHIRHHQQQQQQQQQAHMAPCANGHSSLASTMEHMEWDAGQHPPVDGQGVHPHLLPAQTHAHAPATVGPKAMSQRHEESAAVQHPAPLQAPPAAPTLAPAMPRVLTPPPAPSAPHPPPPHPNNAPGPSSVAVTTNNKHALTATAPPTTEAGGGSGSGKPTAPAAAAAAAAAGHVPHASSGPQPALLLLPPPPAQLPRHRPRLWHKLWAAAGPALSVLTGAAVPAALEEAAAAAEVACGLDPRLCEGWMNDLQGGWVQGGAGGGAACFGAVQTAVLGRRQGDASSGALGGPASTQHPLLPQSVGVGSQKQGVGGADLDAAMELLGRSLAALRVQLQELSVDGMTDAGGAVGTGIGPHSFCGHGLDSDGRDPWGKRHRGRGGPAAWQGSEVEHGAAGIPGGSIAGSSSSSVCCVDALQAQRGRVGALMNPPSGAIAATLVCVLDFLSSSAYASFAAAAVTSEQASQEETLATAGYGNRAANSQLASAQGGVSASAFTSEIHPWVVAALQLLQALLTHSDAAYPILMGNLHSACSSSSSSSSQGHGTVNAPALFPSDARAGVGRAVFDLQHTRVLPMHMFSGKPPLLPPEDPQAKQNQQQQQQQSQPSPGSVTCVGSPVVGGSGTHEGGVLHAMLGVLHRLVLAHASNMQLLACVGAVVDAAARRLPALTVRQALLPVLRWRLAPSPQLPSSADGSATRTACPMDTDGACNEVDGDDGDDDDDDDDSPLMLEALLCCADAQHQVVGVALLHALLESPQILHAVRSAALPGSWVDAPSPSQSAAAAAAAATAERQAAAPPPHAPSSPRQQQHHQDQQQPRQARLNASCVQHMLAALLDCLQLEQSSSPSPGNTPEQCHPAQLSRQLHRAGGLTHGVGGLGWGLGSSLAPSLTFPHSGSGNGARGSAASSSTVLGAAAVAHGTPSCLSGGTVQSGTTQGCSLPSGSLREGRGGVFGETRGGGRGLIGRTSLPEVASAGGPGQQAMGSPKGAPVLVGGRLKRGVGSSSKISGWGVFELQRRALSLLSLLLAARQERLLAVMCCDAPYLGVGDGAGLGQQEGSAEAGGGLAHRLLLLAASAVLQAEGSWMHGVGAPRVSSTVAWCSSGVGNQGGGAEDGGSSGLGDEIGSVCGGVGGGLRGGAAPPAAAVWWCEGMRLAMEALLLLKELLTAADETLRAAAVQCTAGTHPDAQNAAHAAATQLLELKVPPPLQPALHSLDLHQGLPLAPWAHRPALAAHKGPIAALVAGGGWSGSSGSSPSSNQKGRGEGGRVIGADSGVPGAKGLVLGRLRLGGGVDTLVQVASSIARRTLAQLQAVRQDAT